MSGIKIERINIVNQVLKYLEDEISEGIWKPGERIESEINLSNQLQVSRASVRNAIQQLCALGVLESFQGKGTYVKHLPVFELQDRLRAISKSNTLRKLMEFRIIVEGEACRQMAGHISENTYNEMTASVEGMKTSKYNPRVHAKYDFQYHRILMQSTRNEIIIRSIDMICEEIQRQNLITFSVERTELAIIFHETILHHLRDGDGNSAAKAMIKHLQSTPCKPPFDTESTNSVLFNLT